MSTLRTVPLYPQEIFLKLISVRGRVKPRAIVRPGRIMPMKNSSDTIGNRLRHLPACSAVPQPTAPLRAPIPFCTWCKIILSKNNISVNEQHNEDVSPQNILLPLLKDRSFPSACTLTSGHANPCGIFCPRGNNYWSLGHWGPIKQIPAKFQGVIYNITFFQAVQCQGGPSAYFYLYFQEHYVCIQGEVPV